MTRQERLNVGSLLDMAESVVEAAVHLNSLDHANPSYDVVEFARSSYASLSCQLAMQAPTIVKVIKELRLRATRIRKRSGSRGGNTEEEEMPKAVKPTAAKKAAPKKVRITASVIARDVLALLEKKKVLACAGTYFSPNRDHGKEMALQPILEQKTYRCNVCALGAMFVALVVRVNDATVGDATGWDNDDTMRKKLAPYIGLRQIRLIEAAFESEAGYASSSVISAEAERAEAFGAGFRSSRPRLEAICKNMLANGGEFKP